jgi:UrcA family protein
MDENSFDRFNRREHSNAWMAWLEHPTFVRRAEMTTSKVLARVGRECTACAGAALLLGMIGLSPAIAADVETITVSAPKLKIVEHGPGTATATQQVSVSARVQYDPVTLTTNSGVALLKDGVQQAARRVCRDADPGAPEDTNCILNATNAAQPQINAAVARARARAHE